MSPMRTTAGAALVLTLAASPRARAGGPDACGLLTETDIYAAQGQKVLERVGGEQVTPSFRTSQCYYRTAEIVRSVSLALTRPLAGATNPSGPRAYWRGRFHGVAEPAGAAAGASAQPNKHAPPKRVSGLGDEAYWAGDPVSGALYVLRGSVIVRISVGGVPDEEERVARSRALAARALRRLR